MIIGASRYLSGRVDRVPDGNGVLQAALVMPWPQESRFSYTSYMVVEGDRIEQIAFAFYGDPTLWWLIARGNPEILLWVNLTAGTVIRIPSVDSNLF